MDAQKSKNLEDKTFDSKQEAIDYAKKQLSCEYSINDQIIRPNISYVQLIKKIITYETIFVIASIIFVLFGSVFLYIENRFLICMLVFMMLNIIIAVLFAEKITIKTIRIYQNIAPERIRLKCVYYPCCSEYMILSIKKFGFIKGICKEIKRMKRCCYPNGGVDYP